MRRDGLLFGLMLASGAVVVPVACGGSGSGGQGVLLDGGPDGSGSGGRSGDAAIVCVPESIELCTGPNDCAGLRTCNPDGSAWSDCRCGAAGGTGGTSGVGGAGGTGGGAPLDEACAAVCQTMASVGCSSFDLTTCLADCNAAEASLGGCVQEYDAFLRCAATSPASAWACNADGTVGYVDTVRCSAQEDLVFACLTSGTGGTGGLGGTGGTGGVAGICTDTCVYAFDDECDDGGPGSITDICEYGTDCADCGPR